MSTSQNEFKYPHYRKNVAHLKYVDVYRVIELFDVKDHAIGHAIKKLLCSGKELHLWRAWRLSKSGTGSRTHAPYGSKDKKL